MNSLKSFKIIICALLICATFTGCMNSVHLKDMMVVEGMGVDIQDEKVSLFIQTLNADKASNNEPPQGNMTIVTQGEGKAIYDAVSNLGKTLSKKIFFGQNKIIVFSSDLAKERFEDNLDYFLRSTDSRPDVAVCLSEKEAKEIMESKENDAHVPSENIVYLIRNGEEAGQSLYITVNELLNVYYDRTSDIFLPVLGINSDTKNAELKGIGIFDDDRLTYVTDDEETMGFVFIKGGIKNCSVELNDNELGKIGADIMEPKVVNKVEIRDGNVVFITQIKSELMINEVQNGVLVSLDKEKMERICTLAGREIETHCRKAFTACQLHKSDALRVGEYLAKESPKSYDLLSSKWDTYFPNVEYEVSAEVTIKKISDNTQLD